MRIGTNISSLNALRNLSQTTKAFSRAMARLVSGRRIVSARDDAAGIAIAEGLEAQRRGMTQAVRNMNDGRGFLDTAEGAIATQVDIVQRMKELAMRSANGSLSSSDRGYLNAELQQLLEEFNRITSQTQFNGVNLLDGSFGTKSFQVGTQKGNTIDFALPNLQASGVFALRATVGSGSFQSRATYASGSQPRQISTGDFNGDGVADVVVSNTGTNTLGLFLGRSDGTFQTQSTLTGDTNPVSVRIADLNNDGKLDLFATSWTRSTVSIWLGNGNGTFATRTTVATAGVTPVTMTHGDINGDGSVDIIVGDTSSSVSILLGNGNGTFAPRTTIATGAGLYNVALMDLNNDDKLDLVTTDQTDRTVSTYLGYGDGTFATRSTVVLAAGLNLAGISNGGDINGDGKTDLVVAATGGSGRLSILFGNGNGTFPTPSTLSSAGNTLESSLIDMNGDDYLDIVVADYDSNTISIYLGNGDGSFASRTTLNSNGRPLDVTVTDVNGDGVPDILAPDQTNSLLNVYIANAIYKTTNPIVTIATQASAQKMLTVFDNALTTLNSARSTIGGYQNRLDYAESAANTLIENISDAKSRLLDDDIASEVVEVARLQILETAGISVLSQANLSLKLTLKLLEAI